MTAGAGTALYRDLRRVVKRNAARIALVGIPLLAFIFLVFILAQIQLSHAHGHVEPFSPQTNFLVAILEFLADTLAFFSIFAGICWGCWLIGDISRRLIRLAEWDKKSRRRRLNDANFRDDPW